MNEALDKALIRETIEGVMPYDHVIKDLNHQEL
jgi:hypothetical protein